jgi:hypothetical protein
VLGAGQFPQLHPVLHLDIPVMQPKVSGRFIKNFGLLDNTLPTAMLHIIKQEIACLSLKLVLESYV